jgi:hypothetical protein
MFQEREEIQQAYCTLTDKDKMGARYTIHQKHNFIWST